MSESSNRNAGGAARRLLLALLPPDDWSQAFVDELDAELERLCARGAVRHPRLLVRKAALRPSNALVHSEGAKARTPRSR